MCGGCEHAAVVFERDGTTLCLGAAGGDAAASREYDPLMDPRRRGRAARARAAAGGRTYACAPRGRYVVFATLRGRVPTAEVADALAALQERAERCDLIM